MKKIITLLLAISVVATMLVGCGKKDESEKVANKTSVEQKDADNKDKSKEVGQDKKDESNSAEEQKVESKDASNENEKSGEVKNNDSQGNSGNSTQDNSKQDNSNKNDGNANNGGSNVSTPSNQEQSNQAPTPEPVAKHVTISITCNTLLNNMDKVDAGKKDIIPSNGVILGETTVEIKDGDTVFDVLKKQTRDNRIHMDFMESPVYQSVYVKGIANLYEFDGGPLSGWMYSVNGVFPNYGASKYELKNGDRIEWKYTCDLGADLGHGM